MVSITIEIMELLDVILSQLFRILKLLWDTLIYYLYIAGQRNLERKENYQI